MSGLKTRARFPSTIDKEYLAILRDLSIKTRIPISSLMDEALELLFKQYNLPNIPTRKVK